ncbi:MAG: glycosyl transferase family 90 [Pleurocapsa sp.]
MKKIETIQFQASKLKRLEKYSKIHTKIEFEKHHLNAWNAFITFNCKDRSIIYHFYTNLKTFYSINFPYELINTYLTRFPSIRLLQTHQLFINFLKLYPDIKGSFLMSWHDNAKPKNTLSRNQIFITFTCLKTDTLGQCIPDVFFLESQAYSQFRQQVEQQWLQWYDRRAITFWRGASTGSVLTKENWRNNRRVRLCQIAKDYNDEQFIDAKITKLIQIKDREVKQFIQNANLVDSYISSIEFIKYKYVIDIDGNSNSWPGLFTKLLTGSCVLKVESPWKQWYYSSLKPWVNYVPIKNDLSDLIDKIKWCRENDDQARVIGENGRKLALSMTMETEIPKAYQTILEVLR